MPDIITLSCPICGQKLQIAENVEIFVCAECSNKHMVNRSGGVVTPKPVLGNKDAQQKLLLHRSLIDWNSLLEQEGINPHLPDLKPLMQSAARYLELFPHHRFSLAFAPQNVPDAVDHISIVYVRSSRSVLFPTFGKMLLEFLPQFWRQQVEVYRSAFWLPYSGC